MTSSGRLLGRHRRTLFAVAGVLFAGIAAAIMPPPAALAEAGTRAGAALVSAAIVASATLPFLIWRSAARPVLWIALAVGALAAGVASFAVSGYAERTCTTRYAGKPVVIGMELTPLGAAYKQANPGLANDDLLFDAAGVAERIWTPSSIGRCRAFASIPISASAQPIRYDVFLSYRHDGPDLAFARQLLDTLESHGYRVAIDERDFPANASFLLEMERCVRESRFTVAVISSRYLASDNCQEEAIICKVLDMGDRRRRLIPLIIEPVAMPAWLYGIVGIDWTKADPLVDPFDKLKGTLGAPGIGPKAGDER